MEQRNQAFQILKPPCVQLSQAALALQGRSGNAKAVTKGLEDVLSALKKASTISNALNEKLADYVFFPISHVLRQLEKVPIRAKELTLECILVLLTTAWASQIAPPLGIQLLILLTFLGDQQEHKSKEQQTSEELLVLAFTCIKAVFHSLSQSPNGREALTAVDNVPHIGKAVTVMLDGAYGGASAEIQLAAVSALGAFCTAVVDREALGISFLPGIMSCLTKVLTTTSHSKRSYKVLTSSLQILTQLLPFVLGDTETKRLPESEGNGKTKLTKSWLKATAAQIKMALATIIKLRLHDRSIVRRALASLCLVLMQECRESLSESMSMMLETLVSLAYSDEMTEREIKTILTTAPSFSDNLRFSLHSWSISLPRVMLQADESAKQRLIQQVSTAFRLLSEQGGDSTILDNAMAANLRDTVANAIVAPKAGIQVADAGAIAEMQLGSNYTPLVDFEPVMALHKAQEETVADISRFIDQLGSTGASLLLAQTLMSSVYNSSGDTQLASVWIALKLIRNSYMPSAPIDSFLNFDHSPSSQRDSLLEELYAFSISVLAGGSDVEYDWRLQALALETLALQAEQQKLDFRDELVDALYPVVHLVGAPNPQLRNHAIICLNLLAQACGYPSSGELIVQNVDYMVNAVAIRLNTFDISPQAPQVLLMMVKLSGPSLLPYLDDLVDSVFAALELFHGYPRLVGLLFSALRGIVEEGAKAPQLVITNGKGSKTHKKLVCLPDPMDSVIDMFEVRRKRTRHLEEEMDQAVLQSSQNFPEQPWGGRTQHEGSVPKPEETQPKKREKSSEIPKPGDINPSESQPPIPKTYHLLLNISKLTQHYLTSASSELRVSLLGLLDTTIPVLATHENSFLPLIHALWPVLVPRLDDSEAYVVAGALKVIGAMCKHAGDFMRSRIEEIWPMIEKLYSKRVGKAARKLAASSTVAGREYLSAVATLDNRSIGTSGGAQYYVEAPARIIWNHLVDLLMQVSVYVTVADEIHDEMLQILLPILDSRSDVRDSVESWNPDAVWLALLRTRQQLDQKVHGKPGLVDDEFLFAELV